jgi:hypothetical protein
VSDTYTGLVWQQDVSASSYSWVDAQSYCDGLLLNDRFWRLPTLDELESLVDRTVNSGPRINQTAFPNTPADPFWTSSPHAGSSGYAWDVLFNNGFTSYYAVSNTYNVRCVR